MDSRNEVSRGDERLEVEELGISVAATISVQDCEESSLLLVGHALAEFGAKMGAEARRLLDRGPRASEGVA